MQAKTSASRKDLHLKSVFLSKIHYFSVEKKSESREQETVSLRCHAIPTVVRDAKHYFAVTCIELHFIVTQLLG